VYALPLLLMVLGAVAGQQWLPGQDAGAIAGALAGLVAGFGIARIIQSRAGHGYEPTLVDLLPVRAGIGRSNQSSASR
jgi:sigma-E factor negative regulatory protein RseC